jgi:hypothetical protein
MYLAMWRSISHGWLFIVARRNAEVMEENYETAYLFAMYWLRISESVKLILVGDQLILSLLCTLK